MTQAKSLRGQAIEDIGRALPAPYPEANARRMMHALIDVQDAVPEADFEQAKRSYLFLAMFLEDNFKEGTGRSTPAPS